jgi:hypothetical protein
MPNGSGLRPQRSQCRRTYLTILESAWSANFKMVQYVLLRPLRPELEGQDPFGMNTKKDNFYLHRKMQVIELLMFPQF